MVRTGLSVPFTLVVGLAVTLGIFAPSASAQTNPVPLVNQPLIPASTAPGGPGFTLTVNGTGFVSGSVVNWNGSPRATTFVGSSQLTAAILPTDIAGAATASVTVVSPTPGGGISNAVFFPITISTSSVSLKQSYYATGGSYSLAVADINRDGKLDLAIANWGGNTVSILLGNGDGTFQPHVDYATDVQPISVALGDFNGDGKPDLATANYISNTVSILLGNGDGTFQPHVDYATGAGGLGGYTNSVATGDFNDDGRLDLATANLYANTVSILLGNGDGTFQPHVDYATGVWANSVATADFNGDGRLDLATANLSANTVSILLGNGDGTFQPHVDYATIGSPDSVAIADFNGDGRLDLAVSAQDGANSLSILLGNGDGTFQAHVDYSTDSGVLSVQTADLNGDGKLDLAVTKVLSYTLSILLGNGDGTFQPHVNYDTAAHPLAVAIGDFNGDGRLDLATANFAESNATVLVQAGFVQLSPASVTFADQPVGTTSTAQSVTLSNSGSALLAISSVAITGTNAGDFAQTNTCGSSVPAGANCTISVTFTPTAAGTRAGAVTITDDANSPQQTITLTGTGLQPAVTLSPGGLTFGSQLVGTTSAAQAVTLTNSGNASLSISSTAITGTNSGDFAQSNTCGASVAVGGTCAFSITFTPTTRGTKTATLAITDNAPGSPQSIALTGTGTAPAVSFSPTSLTFPSQFVGTTGLPINVTLTNTGDVQLTISNVTTSANFAAISGCTTNLPPGVGCTIGVFFDPMATGSVTGTLTTTDNAPGSPHTVALSGTGTNFSLAPTSSSSTITAGQTATYTVKLSPAGGFNQKVKLDCSGAPQGATCSISPNPITLNGSAASIATVTVTTTARSITAPLRLAPPRTGGWAHHGALLQLLWLLALAMLAGLATVPSAERRARFAGFTLGAALLFVVLWAACGGGSGGGGGGSGTPAGTYSLTISGTATSTSGSLNHSATVNLTVN